MIVHFRLRFPDEVVPEENPEWFFYEVDTSTDNVLRMVNIFTDGRVTRDSVEIEERSGIACPSVLDFPFSQDMDELLLETISPEEFEQLWKTGVDTAFWYPPDLYPPIRAT